MSCATLEGGLSLCCYKTHSLVSSQYFVAFFMFPSLICCSSLWHEIKVCAILSVFLMVTWLSEHHSLEIHPFSLTGDASLSHTVISPKSHDNTLKSMWISCDTGEDTEALNDTP